jgi:hypothetical protein
LLELLPKEEIQKGIECVNSRISSRRDAEERPDVDKEARVAAAPSSAEREAEGERSGSACLLGSSR